MEVVAPKPQTWEVRTFSLTAHAFLTVRLWAWHLLSEFANNCSKGRDPRGVCAGRLIEKWMRVFLSGDVALMWSLCSWPSSQQIKLHKFEVQKKQSELLNYFYVLKTTSVVM
jgi:hypothetical protein